MSRINKVIQRLVAGEVVFATPPIENGSFNDIAALARSAFDMVILETEHRGFDLPQLRTSLQYLLNRARIAERGLGLDPTPFVRIPTNGRELNQWIIKQVLDCGAAGLVLPHVESVESAQAAVAAARYPQRRGAAGPGPDGLRGWAPSVAAEYWGVSQAEYYDRAGIWPLDPDGEVLLMGIVESVRGVEALPEILREAKGIGAIWAGQGDLSVSMGLAGEAAHAEVEAEVLRILRTCKDFGVACAATISPAADVTKRIEQGFDIILVPTQRPADVLQQGLKRVGRTLILPQGVAAGSLPAHGLIGEPN
jgi:4-hydroxy-2-oxoheptanedioate aldolase